MLEAQVEAPNNPISEVGACRYVAVFGTLRRNCGNHGLLRNAQYERTTVLTGYKMYVMSSTSFDAIPFIVKSDNPTDCVTVEIFSEGSLDWNTQMQHLDWLEDHPSWYTRVAVTIDYMSVWV